MYEKIILKKLQKLEGKTFPFIYFDGFMDIPFLKEQGHNGRINFISMASYEKYIISIQQFAKYIDIKIWEIEISECVKTFKVYNDEIKSIAITPNGEYIIIANSKIVKSLDIVNDEYINILKIQDNNADTKTMIVSPKNVSKLQTHWANEENIIHVDKEDIIQEGEIIASDGKYIAITNMNTNTVKIWEIESKKFICAINFLDKEPTECNMLTMDEFLTKKEHKKIKYIVISPNKKYVVALNYINAIKIWDIKSGKCINKLKGYFTNNINFIDVTPDEKYIVVLNNNNIIEILDIISGECVKTFKIKSNNLLLSRRNVSVAIFNKKYILSGYYNKYIKFWDIESGECVKTFGGNGNDLDLITSIAVSKDKKYVISGNSDGSIELWDIKSGECIKTLGANRDKIKSVTIAPNGKYILIANKNTIKTWDIKSGECINKLKLNDEIKSITITADEKYIVVLTHKNTIKIWGFNSKNYIKSIRICDHDIYFMTIMPEKNYIVAASEKVIKIFDIENDECIKTLRHNEDLIESIVIMPGGEYIVFLQWFDLDESIKVRSLKHDGIIRTYKNFSNNKINAIAITPDGKYIVSAHWFIGQASIEISDIKSGECIKILEGHNDEIKSIAITPNGEYIVSGSRDNTIKIWDIESGKCIKTLRGHNDEINSIIITPDGKNIISTDWQIVKIWEIKTGTCVYNIANYADISIDDYGHFKGSDEAIDNYLRISENPLRQRKLLKEEKEYYIKKDDFRLTTPVVRRGTSKKLLKYIK